MYWLRVIEHSYLAIRGATKVKTVDGDDDDDGEIAVEAVDSAILGGILAVLSWLWRCCPFDSRDPGERSSLNFVE